MAGKVGGIRYIGVAHLREILGRLEDDLLLVPNNAGNIAIYRKERQRFGGRLHMVGWVDVLNEKIVMPAAGEDAGELPLDPATSGDVQK